MDQMIYWSLIGVAGVSLILSILFLVLHIKSRKKLAKMEESAELDKDIVSLDDIKSEFDGITPKIKLENEPEKVEDKKKEPEVVATMATPSKPVTTATTEKIKISSTDSTDDIISRAEALINRLK